MEANLPARLLPNLPPSKPGVALPWDGSGAGILPYTTAPAKVTAPVIAGSLATGGVITLTSLGTWSNGVARPASYAYQIQRAGVDIGGATGAVTPAQLPLVVWTAVAADSAVALTCIVTATNPISATASDASNGITIATIGAWADQSPSALSFAQGTGTRRPKADSGYALFDNTGGAEDVLLAGTTPTSIGADGAFTAVYRRKQTTAPGGGPLLDIRTSATSMMSIGTNAIGGAYQPWTVWGNQTSGGGNGVGVAEALDTNPQAESVAYTGGDATDTARFTMRRGGVAKTVVASGASGRADDVQHAVGGAFVGGIVYPSDNAMWCVVVYAGALSAPNVAAAEALVASAAPTYAQFAALGTVVCCLLPGVGWT